MSHDTLLDLSRWQWALTAAFHITFPAVTVGTSAFMVVCYAMYMRTDAEVWLRMFRFWRKIFGVGFAIGVVSGIVLTFEFGLNWGPFAHDVGPIVGVAILTEVIMAFFLEAGLLARRRVVAPIASARTTEQLAQIVPAATVTLTPAEVARSSAITAA